MTRNPNFGFPVVAFLVVLSLGVDVVSCGACDNVAPIVSSWSGGYNVQNLNIPITTTTSQWTIDITFTAAISSLSVWNAASSTTDNTVFHLSSLSYNGQQTAGTTFTSVGFNVGYPSSNAMPTIKSILFNGVNICSGSAATTTTTTTTTTTPAATTKTTAPASGSCASVAVASNSWPGGITMSLNLPFSTTVASWTVDVTFSAAISSISPWNALSSTSNNIVFRLTSVSYNGQQAAGSVYTGAGFNVAYPSNNPMPTVTKVLLNGVNICTGSAVTTTTAAATTTTTTTTTTAAPTTTTTAPTTTKAATTPAPATTAASTGCATTAVVSTSWSGGYSVNLNLPFSSTVTSWTVDVTFTAAASLTSVWNTVSSTSDNVVFHLSNMNYNGQQNAGTVYGGAGFNVGYSSSSAPAISSVVLNGVALCSGSGGSNSGATTTPASTGTTVSTTTTTTTVAPNPAATKYNYADVITKSLLFYQAQRSGHLPANNAISYRADSALGDGADNGVDLTGGYYDAGDFVKFGFPMAYTITTVAWSVIQWPAAYSAAGQMSAALDMIKWGTDYFLKCHISSGGATQRFYGQVGDGNADHAYWGRPEDMTMSRPSFYIDPTHPGSDLAGETAAALAAASIVFSSANPTYAAQCLTAAKQLYTFANQYRATYHTSIANAAGFYQSWSGYGDELAWAAVWLYQATNTSSYLTDAVNHYNAFGLSRLATSFSWDDKTPGVQVLLAKLTGNSAYTSATQAFCDSNVSQLPKTPKGLVYISGWGPLRYAANNAMICLIAGDLNMNPTSYRKFAQNQIHYALGDTGRSFVCGFGVNPPISPHHRSSSCPNRPATCDWNNYNSPSPNPQTLWGALVGGPDASDIYADSRSDYQKNEVACDYNAGFQGAVAGLLNLAINGIIP